MKMTNRYSFQSNKRQLPSTQHTRDVCERQRFLMLYEATPAIYKGVWYTSAIFGWRLWAIRAMTS
jgi:hypothetical protein